MRGSVRALFLSGLLLVSACDGTVEPPDWRDVEVRPDQFALLPCGIADERPCTLIIAGGKRLLFGAPAGIARTIRQDDLRQLDAVILFSLDAADLEGLDEIRNLSWHAGRSEALPVIGPAGIAEIVTALNKAFEQSDARYVVEHGIPTGGYDAAILTARSGVADERVFDTGDLTVSNTLDGFRIDYRTGGLVRTAWLRICGARDEVMLVDPEVDRVVAVTCQSDFGDYQWPLTVPIFVENEAP
ncbi:MAG: hypothetical protein AAF437_05305 [Pseudomonadota bacterium]